MPSKGTACEVYYWAWDTAAGAPKTGDVANHTLKLRDDTGTETTPTNSPEETLTPGMYAVLLTAGEATKNSVVVVGTSATSGVSIIGQKQSFENLPTAAGGAESGLPVLPEGLKLTTLISVGTGTGQLSISSGKVQATVNSSGFGAVVVNSTTFPNLVYQTALGVGIDNASILAFLKSDYDAGNRAPGTYAKAQGMTDVDGKIETDMMLDAATYTFLFWKQGSFGPDTVEQAVA